ncbi:class II glutamine amidotransferase [Actinokineospora cianjurensis]|uniref:Glutamine amidotransferase n=1 Tax=Actinokineospora cianjurensis TaxID=585224 RepID=A0A421B0G7_9PSEU|nr:class II glutamine amidotransferase [Actinokineospora cianjurensis]RLK55613.1 glutamine amidotransferase [Actinokineospora cianjurensis]
MCRWIAYSGSPVRLEDLLYKPENSLIVQSKQAQLGVETTNGDGFGIGWYGDRATPGVYRDVQPAWQDDNLREVAIQVTSRRVFAHVRATTGTAVQRTNCHPFRHDHWLWMHNGAIAGFPLIKRDLVLAVDPELYPGIEGSTDSEVLFYLALTMGLEHDPPAAIAQAVGFVEQVGQRHGIAYPLQLAVATTDGDTTWAFRYSSERRSRSLFHSADISTLRAQYPDNPELHELSDDARLIVSEPLGGLRGAWREVPESTYLTTRDGIEEIRPFTPVAR